MSWFRNIQTQNKLIITFALLALVSALAIVQSLGALRTLQGQLHRIEQEAVDMASAAGAETYVLQQSIAERDYLLTGNLYFPFERQYYDQQFNGYLRQALVASGSQTPDATEDLNALGNLRDQFTIVLVEAENLVAQGESEAALDRLQGARQPATNLQNQLQGILYKKQASLETLRQEADTLVRRSVLLGAASLLLLGALVIAAAAVTNQVAEPMLHITNAVIAFENGAFQPELLEKYTRRRDDLGQLARSFNRMAQSIGEAARSKDELLAAATRFVPGQYLEFLEKTSISDVKLGDHVSAEMAVMFSDIRGFTTMSESMSPQENFDFVNNYLKMVSPLIQSHEGFIVKFLGDGMMAIFPYGVDDAVKAGIQKQQQVILFNEELRKQGLPPVHVGIGIHTGHMMVGMIGEERRIQGDAFSDNVNLTSRVEGLTKYYAVSMIITEESYMRLQQPVSYHMRFIGRTIVKGREKPIALYEIFEGDLPEICAAKHATRAAFEGALKLYAAGRFAEARQQFEAVLERSPHDATSKIYIERCTHFLAAGTPPAWEGVDLMADK